jgi:N,N-dimethylformamidase
MIYWERADGGWVFNAGAIGAAWALDADAKWSTLLRNVLHHFGVDRY